MGVCSARWWCVVALWWWCGSAAERWGWPGGGAALRIDTKLRISDDDLTDRRHYSKLDAEHYRKEADTGAHLDKVTSGRRYSGTRTFDSDGTLDSMQYCRCVSKPLCKPSIDSERSCGRGRFLCCFKANGQLAADHSVGQPAVDTQPALQSAAYFNELEDERPILLPNKQDRGGTFPAPPDTTLDSFGPGHTHDAVLIGPGAPSSGPRSRPRELLLDGRHDMGFSDTAQREVLVGARGVGSRVYNQRPVLVGPGGLTGIVGPARYKDPAVFIGPSGPGGYFNSGYLRQSAPGVLVGPGGPTGIIGPGRQILVGPGGPSGFIGPRTSDLDLN